MTVQDVEGCSTKSPSILPIAVVIDCDPQSLSPQAAQPLCGGGRGDGARLL